MSIPQIASATVTLDQNFELITISVPIDRGHSYTFTTNNVPTSQSQAYSGVVFCKDFQDSFGNNLGIWMNYDFRMGGQYLVVNIGDSEDFPCPTIVAESRSLVYKAFSTGRGFLEHVVN
ncbi:hypothetical protein OPQ81_003313 [Rhizoctonia solani]|nr:hypothetical protein OPQ81_003313 [Rhizoctonia solani]